MGNSYRLLQRLPGTGARDHIRSRDSQARYKRNPFLVGKAIKGMVVTMELARIEGGSSSVGMASDWQFEPIGKEIK